MAFGWIMDDHRAQGIIADIRRRTRTKYKHAVKALKREQDTQKSKKWLPRFNHKINMIFGKK